MKYQRFAPSSSWKGIKIRKYSLLAQTHFFQFLNFCSSIHFFQLFNCCSLIHFFQFFNCCSSIPHFYSIQFQTKIFENFSFQVCKFFKLPGTIFIFFSTINPSWIVWVAPQNLGTILCRFDWQTETDNHSKYIFSKKWNLIFIFLE